MRPFANAFKVWRSHGWKSLSNRFTNDQKAVNHGKTYIILFRAPYFMLLAYTNQMKEIYLSPIAIVAKDGDQHF